ncbi:hypothetical protein VTN77DRAFT_7804 [Rasamsonia byssochlamydoides]|uniref:uncharacterized protein n=1 Tax=Rasamsonia byssochlamydoides TaxID=89139 RepID=UPI00374392F2
MSTPRPGDKFSQRDSGNDHVGNGDQDTTITRLAALSRAPVTPSRFATATPTAIRSAARRTPRGGAPSTPFGLRAIQRRAANTPGRDRRRSGRVQRETPFDILKNLGKALAPISQPIRSSPQEEPPPPKRDEIDELDNEPVPERPRLSLPIDDDTGEIEDGSPDTPPRLSLAFDEDDITQRSVEYPRRAMSEQDRARLSRMSFGDVRLSENFGDLSRLDGMSETGDTTTLQQGNDEEAHDDTTLGQGAFDAGGETEDLGRFNLEFNFPTPRGPDAAEPDLALANDEEDFMLDTGAAQPDTGFPSSDDDDDAAAGDFGLGIHIPDQESDAGTPGIVGGGLRDEPLPPGRKQKKLSRHGIPVPTLPSGVVKKLAMRFARTGPGAKAKISKETLAAIEQASEWFFEQASEDLATYAKHAGRKTIDESDVMTLMRRQRLVNSSNTVFSLAQKHLPKELLQDMRLALPP